MMSSPLLRSLFLLCGVAIASCTTGSGSGSGSGSLAPSLAPTLAPTHFPTRGPTFAPSLGPTIPGDTAHPTPAPTAPTKVVVRQRVVIAGASNMDETALKASIAQIVTNNAQQSGMNVESVFVTIENIDASLLQTPSVAHPIVAVVAERVPEDFVIPEKDSPIFVQVQSSSGVSYSAVVRTDTPPSASELAQLGSAMDSTTSSSTLCSSVPGCTGVTVATPASMAVVTVAPSAAPTRLNNSSNDDSDTTTIIVIVIVVGICFLMALGVLIWFCCSTKEPSPDDVDMKKPGITPNAGGTPQEQI